MKFIILGVVLSFSSVFCACTYAEGRNNCNDQMSSVGSEVVSILKTCSLVNEAIPLGPTKYSNFVSCQGNQQFIELFRKTFRARLRLVKEIAKNGETEPFIKNSIVALAWCSSEKEYLDFLAFALDAFHDGHIDQNVILNLLSPPHGLNSAIHQADIGEDLALGLEEVLRTANNKVKSRIEQILSRSWREEFLKPKPTNLLYDICKSTRKNEK